MDGTALALCDVNTLWSSPPYTYQYNARFDGKECGGYHPADLDRYVMFGAPSEAEPEQSEAR